MGFSENSVYTEYTVHPDQVVDHHFPYWKVFFIFLESIFFWQIWARRGARHENRFWTGDFVRFFGHHRIIGVPSGYVKIAFENGPCIVDLAIKDGDFP